jgi:hypothetical protein
MKYRLFREAYSYTVSQEFPDLLCNPKVYYCDYKSLPLVPILSQTNPLHTLQLYFPKIISNIIYLHLRLGFDSRMGLGIFLFFTASRPALGSTQHPIQGVKGTFSLGVNRPRREADHSPPSTAEVKECVELYLTIPQYVFMAWCLIEARGQL